MQRVKATAEKKSNRAGATPLFRLSAAQKDRGIAPALTRSTRESVLAACMDRNVDSVMQVALQTSQKRRKRCVTSESTVETAKNYKPASPIGGRSQEELGQIR